MPKKKSLLGAGVFLVALLLAFYFFVESRSPQKDAVVLWERFWKTTNFRDIGGSANACLTQKIFREDIVFRANRYFSGWSCDNVGNPKHILSLNFDDKDPEINYCLSESGPVIGAHFNAKVMADLEFIETWDDEVTRSAACQSLTYALQAMASKEALLVHCNVGRDRTGAVSALLLGLAAENAHILDNTMLDAIECDYEKTVALEKVKQGRIKTFLEKLQSTGGIRDFLEKKCHLDKTLMAKAARNLLR